MEENRLSHWTELWRSPSWMGLAVTDIQEWEMCWSHASDPSLLQSPVGPQQPTPRLLPVPVPIHLKRRLKTQVPTPRAAGVWGMGTIGPGEVTTLEAVPRLKPSLGPKTGLCRVS